MSSSHDERTLKPGRLSFADAGEVQEFVETLARFEQGEIGADEWRAYRLVRGVYDQRQDGVHMVRVKIPQGILTAGQLRALAAVARQHSRGFGHVTTRQNVQFHFVAPPDLGAALTLLAEAGLTTREACGNSVRNITACPFAGVARDEVFDVAPYAEALTRFLLRHPLSAVLPRKFKVAWEGCAEDHAGLGIHDLGFHARVRNQGEAEVRGFRVTVGGGTAVRCREASELAAFVPAGETLALTLAVLRVFHERGDFAHRQRNRLKYLIEALGWDSFKRAVEDQWAAVRSEGAPALPFDPERPPLEEPRRRSAGPPVSSASISARLAADALRGPGLVPLVRRSADCSDEALAAWQRTNVVAQRQAGFVCATVTVPLGDLTAGQMEALADLAVTCGDGELRTTSEQNVVLRWVRAEDVAALHAHLVSAGLADDGSEGLADVVSCPGAETCRLAVTQSRGLGRLLGEHLRARADLQTLAPELRLRVSGCPNGCARHHVADIGFQGALRQVGGRAVPHYFVQIGGGVEGAGTRFGRVVAKVPARRAPEAVERLLALYQAQRTGNEDARAFLRRVDLAEAKRALADLAAPGEADLRAEDFADLGEPMSHDPATVDVEPRATATS